MFMRLKSAHMHYSGYIWNHGSVCMSFLRRDIYNMKTYPIININDLIPYIKYT
jgi:hypothetical protein